MEEWRFIMDTDSYSGNFVREWCEYVTGKFADADGLSEHSRMFYHEMKCDPNDEDSNPFQDLISGEYGEYGFVCAEICPTPGRYNDGLGSHYDNAVSVDDPAVIERYNKNAEECNFEDGLGPGYFPCYESSMIYLTRRPTDAELDILKTRSLKFAEGKIGRYDEAFVIKGFRLQEHRKQVIDYVC